MLPEIDIEIVNEEIAALLSPLTNYSDLSDLVKEALLNTVPGFATKNPHQQGQRWLLLPMMVCEAVSGNYEQAIPVTAAMQLLKGAAELFDDIEDQDSSDSLPSKWGLAIATNVATTILILAEKAIARLASRGVPDRRIVRIMDTVNSHYTTACTGQQLDLRIIPGNLVDEEAYLNIIAMKSASQIECACTIGAMLATDDSGMIKIFSLFGHNLGMAVQITNDIQGITGGIDIIRRKQTLPVIYSLAQADGEDLRYLTAVYNTNIDMVPDQTTVKEILFSTGAMHYTTIKLEIYRQSALDALEAAGKAGVKIQSLKSLLEQ
jgi:geranylgeranyl diphosphate synthase type I